MTLWEKIKASFKRLFGKKSATTDAPVDNANGGSEELVKQEEKVKIFESFTEEDKEALLNIVRPLIKGFNSDEFYMNVCKTLADSKILKTYATLSEDGKEFTIKLTQSKLFNEQIADFIADHVVAAFKSSIDAEFFGKFEVESDGGSIVIKKVG